MPEIGGTDPVPGAGAAAHARPETDDLHLFIRTLSPRTRVRVAARTAAGGWANAYTHTAALAALPALDPATPIALHLAPAPRGAPQPAFALVAFDLDAARLGAARAGADADLLSAILTHLSIAHVSARSGPGGGIHLWTAADPLDPPPADLVRRIAAAAAHALPALDPAALLNPATGALRPPGAPHRLGGRSTLTTHTAAAAIALLQSGTPRHAYQDLADLLEARLAAAPPRPGPATARHDDAQDSALPPSITALGPQCRPITTDAGGHPRLAVPTRAPTPATTRALARALQPAQDHSAHAFGVLVALAHAGFTHTHVKALTAHQKASPGLESLRTARTPGGRRTPRSPGETERLLRRQWHLAVHAAARTPPADQRQTRATRQATHAVERLYTRIDAAGTRRWTRPSGPADRATLLALATLILATGRLAVDLDIRRLALMTGYSRQTANASLTRLLRDGWIAQKTPADPARHQARTLTLNPTATHTCPADCHHHTCAIAEHDDTRRVPPVDAGSDTSVNAPRDGILERGGMGLLSELAADVWSARGVGHHAAWTWAVLAAVPRPASTRDLSAATGYSAATTRRHLRTLAGLGLACARPDGRDWERTTTSPAQAALATRARGRGIDRAAAYRTERAVAAWWREEERWLSLDRPAKQALGRRSPARQTVLPGPTPPPRRYPRTPAGRPDHATAWELEADRLLIAQAHGHALEALRRGVDVDPVILAATGATRPRRPSI